MNSRKSKAFRIGNAMAVVLPVDWVRGNGIKRGDLLDVRYDGVVMVKVVKDGEEEDGRSRKSEASSA